MGLDKKRVALHEAGHVSMYLLWDLPWLNASLTKMPDGTYTGVVNRHSYKLMDVPERFLIKVCSIAFSGLIAEQIYLKKRIDWKLESPGSYNDFLHAQTQGLKYMSKEHYATKFAPLVMKITSEYLKKNWGNCVMVIAEQLCMYGASTPEELKPLVKKLDYPRAILNDIVKDTEWVTEVVAKPKLLRS